MRYFTKFDDNYEPMCLFRADGAIEEGWANEGWIPAEFMESIAEGGFQYGAITEEAAKKAFPEAFA
jgi:hypothetical protein